MSNRDVILQISIAALFCVFVAPCAIHARSNEMLQCETDNYHTNNNVTYDSYENYLDDRASTHDTTNTIRRKKRPSSSSRSSVSGKQIQNNESLNKKYFRYSVRKGDTLTSIARKNKVTLSSLRSLNKLNDKRALKKGMVLKVPFKQALSVSSGKQNLDNVRPITSIDKPHFQWPLKSVVDYHHDGLNGVKSIGIIITGKAGSTVHSSASGTVKKIGRMRGFGNYIVINHSGRYSTVYSNLDVILVSIGDTVPAGNAIGKINASEKKIHFQIDLAGKPENPLQYLPKNI